MTLEEIYEQVHILTERINVLEAEKTNEKFVQPLYEKRSKLLKMISYANRDK